MNDWRTVPNTDGGYEIALVGKECRCRSFKNNRWGKSETASHELSNKPHNGRIFWNIVVDGKIKHMQAGYWVAITYPELTQNDWFQGAHIDHIDTDPLNNHPSNLRWVSQKENQNNPLTRKHLSEKGKGRHVISIEHRLRISQCNTGRLLNKREWSKPVNQYTKDGLFLKTYPSIMEAERETSVFNGNIVKCCKGKQLTAGGYVWRYGEEQ